MVKPTVKIDGRFFCPGGKDATVKGQGMGTFMLTKALAPGRAGDVVDLDLNSSALRVKHSDLDPGQAIPWVTEIHFSTINHVRLEGDRDILPRDIRTPVGDASTYGRLVIGIKL